jgi:hypothetical protein
LNSADKTSIFKITACTLPCWVGIVPGKTTIGEARTLIQSAYALGFKVKVLPPTPDYTLAYVLRVFSKDSSRYLLVFLNDRATVPQDDNSIVHDMNIYAYSDTDPDTYVPAVVDMLLALGRPGCLAAQMGNHTAWPTMLFPRYQTKISFGTNDFQVAPDLHASLMISDQSLVCSDSSIAWRGFEKDYRPQFLESMLP